MERADKIMTMFYLAELIITAGGENLAPVPIEDNIKAELPFVSYAMVIGDKKKFLSVLLTPRIVMDSDSGAPTEELATQTKEFCANLGMEVTKSSEIAPTVPEALDQAIKAGISRANAKAISNATKSRLKDELERLESLGVITKVTKPTDWVSNLVVAEKPNGKLRVCIDPQHLNQALKRSHYPLPITEDILPDLDDVKVFSKVDLKEGYLQIELDDDSTDLTTFHTPWGRWKFLRMPFGIKPASEHFQQRFDQALKGLTGIYAVADDALVTGKGKTYSEAMKNHDENMIALLKRCQDHHIKLNADKFRFKCDEIPFIGHLLTPDGVKADPAKIKAILEMEKPNDVSGVQRLIGMAKYVGKFLSSLSDICEPLRRLTHKDAVWNWNSEHDEAFQNIKNAFTKAPVLKFFDPNMQIEGQGDASSKGLGFVLLQDGRPVTYTSRAVTSAERDYSQIEKELLAKVFGMEQNHQYVYGREITLWADHQPLVSISTKPLASAPKRLQRLLLRLQSYDVKICYKPGKQMVLAGTLSRAYIPFQNDGRSETEKDTEIVHMANHLAISEPQLKEIQQATSEDETLKEVMTIIIEGWPAKKDDLPAKVHPYFHKSELATQDGIYSTGPRDSHSSILPPKRLEKSARNPHWIQVSYDEQ
eukprot:Seg247.5 transcript_id=Seg247.5/GoldUCD/mRNA.D3Y31 product="Retrovirus-related Pol polyprotein from transposon 297" pseudo=true protein_id=Seg247.5/GoldUCD/D3Y31